MAVDDLLAQSQPNSSARKFLSFVQPLEHPENLFEILRFDSNAVVPHRKDPFMLIIYDGRNVDRWDSAVVIFDAVADEVLK